VTARICRRRSIPTGFPKVRLRLGHPAEELPRELAYVVMRATALVYYGVLSHRADTFAIYGDDRRAVPGIVRSMGSGEGKPSIPRGMLVSSQTSSEETHSLVSSPARSEAPVDY
jgi:hypothetical protein